MSKLNQTKIPVDIPIIKYKLTKVDNEFGAKFASQVAWVEWGDDDKFKAQHDEPAIGRALIMDPQYGRSFTWLTTTITEIIEQTESYIIFKTGNSHYKLEKIDD